MGSVYLAALIIGLGTIVLQLVMAGHGDADGDVGSADADGAADVHDAHVADGDGFLPILLSVRFWTFGLMAFGMVGTLLHFLELMSLSVVPFVALAAGLGSGAFASWVFRALARAATQSGTVSGDAVGRVGRVLIPAGRSGRTKVRIELGGQTFDYLATTDEELDEGDPVLVMEMREDTAHVTRAPAEFLGPKSGKR